MFANYCDCSTTIQLNRLHLLLTRPICAQKPFGARCGSRKGFCCAGRVDSVLVLALLLRILSFLVLYQERLLRAKHSTASYASNRGHRESPSSPLRTTHCSSPVVAPSNASYIRRRYLIPNRNDKGDEPTTLADNVRLRIRNALVYYIERGASLQKRIRVERWSAIDSNRDIASVLTACRYCLHAIEFFE